MTGPRDIDAEAEIEAANAETTVDLEETAHDEILKFIEARFKGHDLARLVAAVLRAQGYRTEVSPPGPDGGVDILAGSGPLGFDQPRLCVQVKSGIGAEGQRTFNELGGVMSKFDSKQGLLVSWGGFTNPVKLDARKDFFKIRLWNQGDVVDAVLQNYEQLDDEIKAELPLRRIWVMANDDSGLSTIARIAALHRKPSPTLPEMPESAHRARYALALSVSGSPSAALAASSSNCSCPLSALTRPR